MKKISWCLWALFLVLVLLLIGGMCWQVMFIRPCRVSGDCQGRGMDVELVKDWERQGPERIPGIQNIAAWRREMQQNVRSESTGRSRQAEILSVYGTMELVHPARILGGRCGLAAGKGFCVLSEDLAEALFGGTDVTGEWVSYGSDKLQVAGVIQWEKPVLMRPMEEGEVDFVAAEFQGMAKAKKGIKQLLGELDGIKDLYFSGLSAIL